MNDLLSTAVKNLFHPEAEQRTEAAAVIKDLSGGLADLVPAFAGVLVLAALTEPDEDPLEQMLNTLTELTIRGRVPMAVLVPLRDLEADEPWAVEYIEDLLGDAPNDAEPKL
jgi:hypothetical protein